jgi:hypothetical protein
LRDRALPVAALLVFIGLIVAVVVLVRAGQEPEPPRPRPFAVPAPARPATTLDVQQVHGATLTFATAAGNIDAALRPDTAVVILKPASASEAAPCDWVVVSGIANEVLNFTIRRVVIIPAALGATPGDDGIPRLPSGFDGHEATHDPKERPLLAGQVTAVQGQTLTLAGPAGPITLDGGQTRLLQRMTPATPADLREGDRIAYLPARPDMPVTDATALLVLPAGL